MVNTFTPDLIIEVTGVCNRSCVGCYAPNVVSGESKEALYQKYTDLFLKKHELENTFSYFSEKCLSVAVRGGEPTLHPELSILLLSIKQKSEKIFLETHGRWLLENEISSYEELINTIKGLDVTVKISFDKMHGLKAHELFEITSTLLSKEIDFCVAITERNLVDFMKTRAECGWISDEKIIYQPKAESQDELVRPLYGVINTQGKLKKTLQHNFVKNILEVKLA